MRVSEYHTYNTQSKFHSFSRAHIRTHAHTHTHTHTDTHTRTHTHAHNIQTHDFPQHLTFTETKERKRQQRLSNQANNPFHLGAGELKRPGTAGAAEPEVDSIPIKKLGQ